MKFPHRSVSVITVLWVKGVAAGLLVWLRKDVGWGCRLIRRLDWAGRTEGALARLVVDADCWLRAQVPPPENPYVAPAGGLASQHGGWIPRKTVPRTRV